MKKVVSFLTIIGVLNSCTKYLYEKITGEHYEYESKTLEEKIDEDLSKVDINERINESMEEAKKEIKEKEKEPLKLDSVLRKIK